MGFKVSDGRMCAIRSGSRGLQGSDGRMVEIPSGVPGVKYSVLDKGKHYLQKEINHFIEPNVV